MFSTNTTVYAHWYDNAPSWSGGGGDSSTVTMPGSTTGTVTVNGVSIPYAYDPSTGTMTVNYTASLLDQIVAAAGGSNPIVINMGGPAEVYSGGGTSVLTELMIYDGNGKSIQNATVEGNGDFSITLTKTQIKNGVTIPSQLLGGQLINKEQAKFFQSGRYTLSHTQFNRIVYFNTDSLELRGRVIDQDNQPIAGAQIEYLSPVASTGASGYFSITLNKDWMEKHLMQFDITKSGYTSASFWFQWNADVFSSLAQNGFADMGDIRLTEIPVNTPFAEGWISVIPSHAQRDKYVQVFVHYRSSEILYNATLSVTLPAGVYVENNLYGRDPITITTSLADTSDIYSVLYYMVTSHGYFGSSITWEDDELTGFFDKQSYMGSGSAEIILELTKMDGSIVSFTVARPTLLIDPSGYVYDKTTNARVEGRWDA